MSKSSEAEAMYRPSNEKLNVLTGQLTCLVQIKWRNVTYSSLVNVRKHTNSFASQRLTRASAPPTAKYLALLTLKHFQVSTFPEDQILYCILLLYGLEEFWPDLLHQVKL